MNHPIPQSRELRLIDTPEGIVVGFLDKGASDTHRYRLLWVLVSSIPVLFIALFSLAALPSLKWLYPVLISVFLVGLAGIMTQSYAVYHRLRIGPRALHLNPLKRRTSKLSIEEVRANTNAKLTGQLIPPKVLPYADIRSMGHTEYSVWFELQDGTREEVMMENIDRKEIERLHHTIRPLWERTHASLTDTEAEASQSRQRLRALQSS